MDTFARLSPKDRQAYIEETASRRNTTTTIIEKDFWVCWTLKQLFDLQGIPRLSFKGGTSLSKVYHLIQRFSEDIDVSLDRASLGFSGERDLAHPKHSKTKRKQLDTELRAAIGTVVRNDILSKLRAALEDILGTVGWQVTPAPEADEEMTLEFQYPTSLVYETYLRPLIKIEFGRGDQHPSERRSITPYVAEEFSSIFPVPDVTLNVLACERTFWEKMTLLHAEFHRPEPSTMRPRMSRHWYDVAVMSTDSRFADDKLSEALLREVIAFKASHFPSGWANYGTALPGALRLVPHQKLVKLLRDDFKHMKEMIWGEPISFEDVLARLKKLEDRINAR
jgi:Nucleotidyl transferase AbiEii toxin, Type IV TA system